METLTTAGRFLLTPSVFSSPAFIFHLVRYDDSPGEINLKTVIVGGLQAPLIFSPFIRHIFSVDSCLSVSISSIFITTFGGLF